MGDVMKDGKNGRNGLATEVAPWMTMLVEFSGASFVIALGMD
jgi:hypothetical protein